MLNLFPQDSAGGFGATITSRNGILPYQALNAMRRNHEIFAVPDILSDQVQPASIDLRLGTVAYRVRASFLPGPEATVAEKISQLDGYAIELTNGRGLA